MKKILIANDLLQGGGVETILYTLVCYLVEHEYEVSLMIPDCNEKDIAELFGTNVKLYPKLRKLKYIKRFTLRWFYDRGLFIIESIFYYIKFWSKQFDVVLALKEGLVTQETAHLYGKKKIAWIHIDYSVMHTTKDIFGSVEAERKCMKKYDTIVCVSYAVKKSVISTVGDTGNLCVRYNPINYREIREKAKEEIEEFNNNKCPLFLAMGRLDYPKNYSTLIEICKEISAHDLFELWIIGDGPEREELQKKINDYNLNCVKLLGTKMNPFPYLAKADVFISTSLVESYGLAIQEALILGKPVVALNCPAIEETFDDRFGILFNP